MQANSRQKTKSSIITREEEDTNRETKMQKNVATLYMEDYEKMKKKMKHSEQQQQRQQQQQQ
jgi:hypothetical protein